MSGKELTRIERGVRFELSDLRNLVENTVLEAVGQFVDRFVIGSNAAEDMSRGYIIRGFTVTSDGAGVLTITNGDALLPYYHQGEVKYGMCLTAGPTSRTIDMSALSDGTYYVWVKAEFRDGAFANRLALDPLQSPVVERVRNIPTRKIETWSATVAASSPGSEWVQIARNVWASGADTLLDTRELFFEGKFNIAGWGLVPPADWGRAADQDDDRSVNGVFGLRKFVRAVQAQLENLKLDGTTWWQAPVKTMFDKLNRDGTNTVTGDIKPETDGIFDLGDSSFRYGEVHAQDIAATTVTTDVAVFSGANPAMSTGYTNTALNANTIKAWGVVTTDGSGGFSDSEGFNIASVVLTDDNVNGDYITVTLADAVDTAGKIAIIPAASNPGGARRIAILESFNNAAFTLRCISFAGTADTALTSSAGVTISFVVLGLQS